MSVDVDDHEQHVTICAPERTSGRHRRSRNAIDRSRSNVSTRAVVPMRTGSATSRSTTCDKHAATPIRRHPRHVLGEENTVRETGCRRNTTETAVVRRAFFFIFKFLNAAKLRQTALRALSVQHLKSRRRCRKRSALFVSAATAASRPENGRPIITSHSRSTKCQ